jgi:putative Ca2+/H+ antiporter (TMEM165/GDT1 family)
MWMKFPLCVAAAVCGLAMMFLLPVALILFMVSLVFLVFGFWIWMLVDAIKNQGLTEGEKIGWVLAIVFLHFIGSILYFFIGRPRRNMARVA